MPDVTVLDDIEAGVLAKLQAGCSSLKEFNITAEPNMIACPGVNVSCFDGDMERITASRDEPKFGTDIKVLVTVVIQNSGTERDRKKAINALIIAVISLLTGKKLTITENSVTRDVDAKPLEPLRFRQVLNIANRIGYVIEFETRTIVQAVSDEAAADLLALAVSYLLTPGDQTADANDEVPLTGNVHVGTVTDVDLVNELFVVTADDEDNTLTVTDDTVFVLDGSEVALSAMAIGQGAAAYYTVVEMGPGVAHQATRVIMTSAV